LPFKCNLQRYSAGGGVMSRASTRRKLRVARAKDLKDKAAKDAAKDTQSSITTILNELNPERLPRYLQIDTWYRAGWINSIVAGLWWGLYKLNPVDP
jgi:hypothetical protein